MDMLSPVPKGQSIDEAEKIMEGLTTLRPQLVQSLLEECKSIKVKRLFLFIAEKYDHGWLDELNIKKDKSSEWEKGYNPARYVE